MSKSLQVTAYNGTVQQRYDANGDGTHSLAVTTQEGRGTLPSQWVGNCDDFPPVQAPVGWRLVADIFAATKIEVLVKLDGNTVARLQQEGSGAVSAPSIRLDCGNQILSTNGNAPVLVRWHYEPIVLSDGIIEHWDSIAAGAVGKIFGRQLVADGDDISLLVPQHDALQRNGNGSFSFAALVSLAANHIEAQPFIRWYKNDIEFLYLYYGTNELTWLAWSGGATKNNLPLPFAGVLVGTYDGLINEARLYFDGVLGQTVGPGMNASPGATNSGTLKFLVNNGEINTKQFTMWNRALSAVEVAALGTSANPTRWPF